MKEEEIRASIDGHRARNLELRKTLGEYGVNFGTVRKVDINFFAPDGDAAAQIAHQMYARGYLVRVISRCETESKKWNIEVEAQITPDQVLGEQFTEDL